MDLASRQVDPTLHTFAWGLGIQVCKDGAPDIRNTCVPAPFFSPLPSLSVPVSSWISSLSFILHIQIQPLSSELSSLPFHFPSPTISSSLHGPDLILMSPLMPCPEPSHYPSSALSPANVPQSNDFSPPHFFPSLTSVPSLQKSTTRLTLAGTAHPSPFSPTTLFSISICPFLIKVTPDAESLHMLCPLLEFLLLLVFDSAYPRGLRPCLGLPWAVS